MSQPTKPFHTNTVLPLTAFCRTSSTLSTTRNLSKEIYLDAAYLDSTICTRKLCPSSRTGDFSENHKRSILQPQTFDLPLTASTKRSCVRLLPMCSREWTTLY